MIGSNVERQMTQAAFRRHRREALLLAVAALIALVAAVRPARATFKVALICSGSFTDGGWNQQGRAAIVRVGRQLHLHVSAVEHVSPVRAVNVMRDYLMEHYNLVIGHGYEFLLQAAEIAAEGGSTKFAVCGADQARPHIATLAFDLAGPSYQLGVLAALLTKSGKLGFIGGQAIPSVVACYRGFVAGARGINPRITVAQAYTSWDQPALSRSQAEAFIQQGIDVIYQNVDAASRGVFEAVRRADESRAGQQSPVYVFGSNRNQNNNTTCGAFTPASAVIHMGLAFRRLVRAVQRGNFKPGVVPENMADGVCVAVLNPRLEGTVITAAMQRAVAHAAERLRNGKIRLR